MLNRVILVTGAARSGKSEWAETLAQRSQQAVVYVATAQTDPTDDEWQRRIDQHRQRRSPTWKTLDVPLHLAATIRDNPADVCLLVDSLGTWVANWLEQDDLTWTDVAQELLWSLHQTTSQVIFVSEEVGWGVVPSYPTGRLFRDRLGSLTRQIGAMAGQTYLVTAGHVLNLNALGQPLSIDGPTT